MTRDEIDIIWQRALDKSVRDGAIYTRYHFAAMIEDAERERCCAIVFGQCSSDNEAQRTVEAIRARNQSQ